MLTGHESAEPEICSCCCRPAVPVGVIKAPGAASVLWLCTFCTPALGQKVADMKANQLHTLEKQALAAAIKTAPVDVVGVVLRCLTDHGVKALSDLNEYNYPSVREIVRNDERFTGAVEALLLAWTQQMRRELVNLKDSA